MFSRLLFLGFAMLLSWSVQAQFPCFPGQVGLAHGFETSFCDDGSEPALIRFKGKPAGLPHAFVVVDADDVIVHIGYSNTIDFAGLGDGLRVYSFSLIGSITADVGDILSETELASGCYSLSTNFIEIDSNGGQDGGTLAGGPFSFCVGDGIADMIPTGAITLTGNNSDNTAWVITDDQGNILGLPPSPDVVDFDGAGLGTCLVWHLSYIDGLTGLEADLNINDLDGCYDLSNPISVNRSQPEGGTLAGGPFSFCAGDGVADMIPEDAITVSGSSGSNFAWIVTDDQGNILGLPPTFSAVDFDGAGAGTCLVWYLRYEDGLTGLAADLNIDNLEGCFDLSNSITVNRSQPEGGILAGGPFSFCAGDGVADMIPEDGITVSGSSGSNFAWIVTDDQGNILGLPPTFSAVDFDGAGAGACLVWYLRYENGLTGLAADLNIDNLEGCFDLSNSITVNRSQPEGGTLAGGPFSFCVGDGVADMIPEDAITVSGSSGSNFAWIVTDDQGNILGLPPTFSAVDFDGAGAGACLVWYLRYEDGLTGLETDLNIDNLEGCFDLSNSITVNRSQPEGGTLAGGPFSFCVGDGVADMIPEDAITVSGSSGSNFAWIVTDDQGNILGLPPTFSAVDFDGAGAGACLVWYLRYEDGLTGLAADLNIDNLEGCFDLSNSITVNRSQPEGGTLAGGPFSFCVGDGVADMIPEDAITVSGSSGSNFAWIVTDDQGNILGLPPTFSAVDFDGAGAGACLVWYLRYEDGLTGLAADLNIDNLEGCFDLSNSITVNRSQPEGGILAGGPFSFCVGDGVADMIPEDGITVSGSSGSNFAWIVTDDQGNILGLPPTFSAVDFDGAGAGACLVWYLRYEDGLTGLAADLNIDNLEGCFDLSNSITVNRSQPEGGTLAGGPFSFCAGDGVADMIPEDGITVSGSSGSNFAWIVTDDQGNILGLPPTFSAVDFDGAGAGTCLVWYLRYEDGLTGLAADLNIDNLQGCYGLSNSISVNRTQPEGGTLEGGVYEFCVGDGVADMLESGSITLTGNSGTNSAWVVTDDQGNILGLPPMPSAVDFDGAGVGTCLIWHLSFEDGLVGAEEGLNANDLQGCFDLSNPITVNRIEGPDCDDLCNSNGGFLTGGPFAFCAGDGIADMIPEDGITVSGSSGSNFAWVVTDDQGNILGLPPTFSAVDFDGAGAGTCLVWYLRYEDGLTGLAADLNIDNLEGCFDLSNAVAVSRSQPEGGMLEGGPFTFCVGDGEADMIDEGAITLTGNSGSNSAWVVTDDQGNILGLPPTFSVVNFDGAGTGACLVWHLSFEDALTGLATDLNIDNLEGCYSLSNPITVERTAVNGGMVSTIDGENNVTVTVGDGIADVIQFTNTASVGENFTYIVTDENNMILAIPSGNTADFEDAPAGVCRVWGVAYSGNLLAIAGDNIMTVALSDACANVSDIFVTINRTEGFSPNVPQNSITTAILDIQLFPNPATDQLQVEMIARDDTNENITLSIINLSGQVLYQQIIDSTQNRTTVDVANLPAGTYFLRSNDGTQVITKRFIKA